MSFTAFIVAAFLPGSAEGREQWFDIVFRGRKVGVAVERCGAADAAGLTPLSRYAKRVYRRGKTLVVDESSWSGLIDVSNGRIDSFRYDAWSGSDGDAASRTDALRIDVEWMGGELSVVRSHGGKTTREVKRLPMAPMLASVAGRLLVGQRTLASNHHLACGAADSLGRKLTGVSEAVAVVDDETGIVRTESTSGRGRRSHASAVRNVPVSAARAKTPFSPVDLIAQATVPTNARLAAPFSVSRMRVLVRGPLASFPFAERADLGGRDATREVRTIEITPKRRPVRAREIRALGAPLLDNALRDLALSVTGGGDVPPDEAGARLSRFVHLEIQSKSLTRLRSSVGAILASREGDCTEHALLLAHLLESIGIRARIVLGFVYAGGAFALHEWVDAAIGGYWRSYDPTLNQTDVDATHITVQTYAPDEAPSSALLSHLVGRMPGSRFEVVAVDVGDGWRPVSPR